MYCKVLDTLDFLRVSHKPSSSYRPQTNGQIECTNQTLEQYLHCFINYQQDDWIDFLHMTSLLTIIQSILTRDTLHPLQK